MSDKEGVGRALEPTKMHVNKFQTPSLDRFGQEYNSDTDKSKWSGEGPQQTRRDHDRADTDISHRALHHTLGIGHNQASPGDHYHDGTNSKKIGPLEIDPTGTDKTRPEWTIPLAPSVADLVTLLNKFVNFRQV